MELSVEVLVGAMTIHLMIAGIIWRAATKISKLETEVTTLKSNGIADIKRGFFEFREEFREFRSFVMEKLT